MESFLSVLPHEMGRKIRRYRRWQDQQSAVLGKLLLLYGLQKYGYGKEVLESVEKEKQDKPFIPEVVDFNISHSGRYVLCGFNPNGKIHLGYLNHSNHVR